jgi:hypothetical protein
MFMSNTQKLHNFMQNYIMIIAHASHQDIIIRKDTTFIYIKFFSCHFYTLKSMNFSWTYCFTIFARILLKFCDDLSNVQVHLIIVEAN